MVNKGKIIFVNGYWDGGIIGKLFSSTVPGKKYWGSGNGGANIFEKTAENFFGVHEAPDTHLYMDASSVVGGDSDGADRFNKGQSDYRVFDDAYFKRYIQHADKAGIYAGSNIRAIEKLNKATQPKYDHLISGMNKSRHAFYIVTHSEGGGYGAGLAKFLIKDGWRVDTVVHLSTDEADDFDTPTQPMTYQLGLKSGKIGDFVTGNYQIRSGVDKWGIVDDETLPWDAIHGFSKNENVFRYLEDLRTVAIKMDRQDGRIVWKQIPNTCRNGSKFSLINGILLNYK